MKLLGHVRVAVLSGDTRVAEPHAICNSDSDSDVALCNQSSLDPTRWLQTCITWWRNSTCRERARGRETR